MDNLMPKFLVTNQQTYRKVSVTSMDAQAEHRNRLSARMRLLSLREAAAIAPKNSSLFSSLSYLLFETEAKTTQLKSESVSWLRSHQDFELGKRALKSFVPSMDWGDYCSALGKDDSFGDLLAVVAISELYKAKIVVISSADKQQYTTSVAPAKFKTYLFLSLCNDLYFGALESVRLKTTATLNVPVITVHTPAVSESAANNYDEEEPDDEPEDKPQTVPGQAYTDEVEPLKIEARKLDMNDSPLQVLGVGTVHEGGRRGEGITTDQAEEENRRKLESQQVPRGKASRIDSFQ